MTKTFTTIALAALFAFGLSTPIVAHAASDTTAATSKQRSGDGDTGAGDRAVTIGKQPAGDGDTGAGDRAVTITKQRTGDGDTGVGDRPTPLAGASTRKP